MNGSMTVDLGRKCACAKLIIPRPGPADGGLCLGKLPHSLVCPAPLIRCVGFCSSRNIVIVMRIAALAILSAICFSTSAQAQIDWRAPGAAGKVWGDKIDENNREARNRTPEERARADAADAAWDAPLSQADIAATLKRNRAEYDRKLRLGKGHADRWLDRTARLERLERQ